MSPLTGFKDKTDKPARRLPAQATMVRALAERDLRFAQRFIVAVRTTKIYCIPGCPAPPPKPQNVDFVADPEAARALGCRACKRCHPDTSFYGIPAEEAAYEQLLAEIGAHPERFPSVEAIARHQGAGLSRLHQRFREFFHQTPHDILNLARVQKAAALLLSPGASAGEVGLDVGFASTSVYYQQFGRLMGMSPAAYGRLRTETSFRIELPEAYPVALLLKHLNREALDPLKQRLSRLGEVCNSFAMRLPTGGRFQFRVASDGIDVEVDEPGSAPEAHRLIVRMAALGFDSASAEAQKGMADLASGHPGLRVFQTVDLFDAVVWAIVGQQLSFGFAVKLRYRLYEWLRPYEGAPWSPLRPDELAGLTIEQLVALQYSQRKAEYLLEAAKAFAELDPVECRSWSFTKTMRFLKSLRGFGPWSTNYVLMRGCGFADCVLIGDVVLAEGLARHFGLPARPGPGEQGQLMEQFSPYRSLATYHLCHSASANQAGAPA